MKQKKYLGSYKTPWGEELYCTKCGSAVVWQECDQCEDGYSYHDCGEDTCCCLDPLPNVVCDVCDGEGGWYLCLGCNKLVQYCSCKAEPIIPKNQTKLLETNK